MVAGRSALLMGMLALLIAITCYAEIPLLSGDWAMVQIYPQTAVLPFAGEVHRASYVVQWVTVEQDGATLTMTDRYCFTHVDDGTELVQTTIPAPFMAALDPEPRTASLSEVNAEIQLFQDVYVEVRGAALDDAINDDLPTEPSDERVIDQDEDGAPGMSVSVRLLGIISGETYVVQRVRYALSGRVITTDRIEGTIDWTDEQTVLEATNPLLKVDTIGYPDPDPTKSRFIMIRVPEETTCDWLGASWWEPFDVEKPGGISNVADASTVSD